jgi:uncharacterized protein YndB with AHSA1/START domain
VRDLIEEMAAVRRTVGDDTLPAGEAKVVRMARTYRTDADDLWEAITTPERIARWFLPVTGDLRLGGTYQLEGNAGGEIRVCDPPAHLRLTWIFGDAPAESSFVDVHLSPDGDGTRLELVHTAVVPPEMWDRFGPGAVGTGWDLGLVALAAHLAGEDLGAHLDLETDPAIRAAYTASSDAWGEASRAAGIEPDVVAGWVAATTAFYVPPLDGDDADA